MNFKMNLSLKRIIYTIIGIFFLGAGVAFITIAGLGTNPLDALDEVISNATGIAFARITFVAQILMVLISLLLWPKNVGIGTIMAMFLTQVPIDITYHFISRSPELLINIIFVLLGIILMTFGAGLVIVSGLGMGTYEALTFSIAYRFNLKFVYTKYILDSIFLILAIIFKGQIGIGTILIYLLSGKLIDFFKNFLETRINFD